MNEDILLPHIRAVTEKDKKQLPLFSYSKIEQFLNCPMAYSFKYNQKMTTKDTSLALELGSLLHAVLEYKGHMLRDQGQVDYNILDKLITDGIIEKNKKTKEEIAGLTALKKKYWEIWSVPDSEGRTYDEKMQLFRQVLSIEMEGDDWKPYAFEMPFEFVWDNKVILHGFIDRIDKRDDQFRVIDYKSSKKPFPDSKLPTSLQFGIYALACLNDKEINCLPSSYIYRFIMLDEYQNALTKGWEKRLEKKLTQIFDAIDERDQRQRFEPKPSPLCFYCLYSSTNPNAHDYKDMCEYHSLWSPDNKTFEKNKEWNALEESKQTKRKLIF